MAVSKCRGTVAVALLGYPADRQLDNLLGGINILAQDIQNNIHRHRLCSFPTSYHNR